MLDVLRQIEKRGAAEMARRQAQVCGQIFRYAISCGKATIDPVPKFARCAQTNSQGHHAAITAEELPEFLEAFEKIEGRMYAPTRIMFRLMMMTFVRTSELTTTEWSEIDFEKQVWMIPWQRMKMGKKKCPLGKPIIMFSYRHKDGTFTRATHIHRQQPISIPKSP